MMTASLLGKDVSKVRSGRRGKGGFDCTSEGIKTSIFGLEEGRERESGWWL